MSTPLTDSINALTAYANEVTGASDTTLSDAVHALAQGYGQGGTPKWKDFSGGNIQAIIGDGNSYINTGLTITDNHIFSAKFKPNATVSYEYVFGTNRSNNVTSKINLQRQGLSNTWLFTLSSLSGSAVTVSDTVIMMKGALGTANVEYDLPLLLFRGYHQGRIENQTSKITFYGLNIVDENNEYIHKFVPWKDENDIICVKNLVTGDIYYNAGTGTFGYIDADGVVHT